MKNDDVPVGSDVSSSITPKFLSSTIKNINLGGQGLIGKVLALQAQGSETNLQNPCKDIKHAKLVNSRPVRNQGSGRRFRR